MTACPGRVRLRRQRVSDSEPRSTFNIRLKVSVSFEAYIEGAHICSMTWTAAATSRPITQRHLGAFVVTAIDWTKVFTNCAHSWRCVHRWCLLSHTSIISVQLRTPELWPPSFNWLVGRRAGDYKFFRHLSQFAVLELSLEVIDLWYLRTAQAHLILLPRNPNSWLAGFQVFTLSKPRTSFMLQVHTDELVSNTQVCL